MPTVRLATPTTVALCTSDTVAIFAAGAVHSMKGRSAAIEKRDSGVPQIEVWEDQGSPGSERRAGQSHQVVGLLREPGIRFQQKERGVPWPAGRMERARGPTEMGRQADVDPR